MTDTIRSRILVITLGIPGQLVVIYFGQVWFALFITVVLMIGAHELQELSRHKESEIFTPLLYVSLGLAVMSALDIIDLTPMHILLLLAPLTFFIELFRKKSNATRNITTTIFGYVWLGLMMGSAVRLRNFEINGYPIGFELTLSMFVTVWVCDSFAYLFGKKYGIKKILPHASPNKSWVGCIAGVIGAVLTMTVFYYAYAFKGGVFFRGHLTLTDALMLALIYGIFGQGGDFAESLIKRDAGIKDTSHFLLGHGGVLDRFDSLMFTTPLAYLYALYFIQ